MGQTKDREISYQLWAKHTWLGEIYCQSKQIWAVRNKKPTKIKTIPSSYVPLFFGGLTLLLCSQLFDLFLSSSTRGWGVEVAVSSWQLISGTPFFLCFCPKVAWGLHMGCSPSGKSLSHVGSPQMAVLVREYPPVYGTGLPTACTMDIPPLLFSLWSVGESPPNPSSQTLVFVELFFGLYIPKPSLLGSILCFQKFVSSELPPPAGLSCALCFVLFGAVWNYLGPAWGPMLLLTTPAWLHPV